MAQLKVQITVTSGVCMTVETQMTHPQCSGDSTGRIVVTPTNGTAPFFYSWSNYEGDSIVDHLPSGKYRVMITDATGCTTVRLFTLNQGTQLLVSNHITAPQCKTNKGEISVTVTGGSNPYRYRWANNSSETNVLTELSAGLYSLTVSDNSGCKTSVNIALNDEGAPQIIVDSVKESPCGKSLGAIYTYIKGNYDALRWSNDSTDKQITQMSSQDYTLTVTAGNCKSSQTIYLPHPAMKQPQLALVSIDSAFKKNLVVWLRDKDTTAISHYRIYRDGMPIVTVPYREYSVYHDTAAIIDPSSQPYTYQIMALNACKEQTPLSASLSTLYLQANESKQIAGGVDLRWGVYNSQLALNKYIIYRSNGHSVVRIDSVINKTMFTDKTPGIKPRYFVALSLNDSIMVSQLKTDTGPFSQSFSNMSEASVVFASATDGDSFDVYPNPSSTVINITLPNAEGAVISLIAANGAVITQVTTTNGTVQLPVNALPRGIYTVQAHTNDKSISKTVIIQ